ncbi:MAG: hypothetical protein NTW08_03070 [Gammaproteobacteria bacterium]|nr:hypothetical protein [Gammaproteobacteria bacterium]
MMAHTHLTHHPDTMRAPFFHHELTFSQDDLEHAFARYPNQVMSKFGVQNAQQMMSYLSSPEGRLVKSVISTEIMKMLSLKETLAFEQREEMALQRRILAFLISRYLHDKARHARQQQLELEHLIEEAFMNTPAHAVDIAHDTSLAYQETLYVLERSIERHREELEDYTYSIEESKKLEKRLEDFFADLEAQFQHLSNAGEAFAEMCIAVTEQFSEQLQESMDDIDQRIKSLEQKQTAPQPKPTPSGQQGGAIQDIRRLQEQKALHADTLQHIKAFQQAMRGLQPNDVPHQAIRLEANKVMHTAHQHVEGLEKQKHIQDTRLHRLIAEKDQLSTERQSVLNNYDQLSQRMQASNTQVSQPSPSPTPFETRPSKRPR